MHTNECQRVITGEKYFFYKITWGLFRPTWSLAVEEHFYLLVAATVALYQGI